jgi:cobalt/nickel transport system permease protein
VSHLHIPDGVLPLWLIVAGWILAGSLLAFVSLRPRSAKTTRQLPLLGVMAALMLVGMTVEIVPIAYHINLAVMAGIVLGPMLGFLAAFIVNLMLAFFGHGGITVVGLNTLVVAMEAVVGFYLFRAAWSALAGRIPSPAWPAAGATVIALALSTTAMIGIVGLSAVGGGGVPVEHDELSFRNPFEAGLLSMDTGHEGEEHEDEEHEEMSLATFAGLVYALGFFGWILEAGVTGAIVGYVARLRPDLVGVARRPDREVGALSERR